MATKTILIELELTESQIRNIADKITDNNPDVYKIAGVAKDSVLEISKGGFVVEGAVAKQILALTGPIGDSQELVGFVERGMGREDGCITATWKPDVTYTPVLEDAARSQGITIQELVQGLMDTAAANGWCYAINPEVKILFVSRDDARFLSEVLGQKPEYLSGTAIADFVRKSVELPELEAAGGGAR
jgi:hypothetical protein